MNHSGPRDFREDADLVTASQAYAQRFSGAVGEYFIAEQTRAALAMAAPWPGSQVLDVGGGHAQLAPPLAKAGYGVSVAGSSEQCRVLLDRAMPSGGFQFQAGDLMNLPFEDRSFDLVFSFRMLTHVADPAGYVKELCRLADKAVVVDYPAKRSFNLISGALFGAKQALDDNVHTREFVSFWDHEVLALFQAQGFGRPLFRRQHFLPMALHRGLKNAPFTRASEKLARGLGLATVFGSPVVVRMERL